VKRPNPFWQQFTSFVEPMKLFGAINSLAQVLLKFTSPGVPDVYRGTEVWDLSLVDPDNRRPVDYDARQQALAELLKYEHEGGLATLLEDILKNMADGRAKLWTTLRTLRFRREHNELFRRGMYTPLLASNHFREHVVAFARQLDDKAVITAVPRFTYTLMSGGQRLPIGEDVWKEAALKVPEHVHALENVLTGETLKAEDGQVLCREIFAHFPVALLTTP
jgi:(1->4)-alpha-D-glucan 1-alpha-D-glucosylmutase